MIGKNFDSSGDISPDVESNVGSDTGTACNGDLAGDTGVDLNAGDISAAERIAQASMSNAESPRLGTQVLSGLLGNRLGVPPGEASDSFAQLVQMGRDGAPVAAEEYMGATIRQHGDSPAGTLENIQINQAIGTASEYQGAPLREQDYYDENGVNITDEKLRE